MDNKREVGRKSESRIHCILEALHRSGDWWAVRAFRDGLVATIPIIVLGSMFLLIGQIDSIIPVLKHIGWVKTFTTKALDVYRMSLKILSLYLAFSMAYSVANYMGLPPLNVALASVLLFLILAVRVHGYENGHMLLDVYGLSSEGIFLAIVSGWSSAFVFRLFSFRKVKIEGLPDAVLNAITALMPATSLILIGYILSLSGFDIASMLTELLVPLKLLGDSILAVIVVNVIVHLLWFFGLHGVSIVDAVMLSLWLSFLQANAEAISKGISPPYVTAHPFWQWFVWIGGSGAGLSLWLACALTSILGGSQLIKRTVKLSAPTVIFNINEPLVFGLPVVMNHYLLLPFILVPIVNGSVAFIAVKLGWVNAPIAEPPWVLPNPIGVLIATGFDLRAVLLTGINLILGTIIYLPFVMAYDRVVRENNNKEESG